MVNTSNRGWRNGMNETEDVIYKSYYKTLDRPPLNDIVKAKKGLHLYRKLQAEIKHFQRIQSAKSTLDQEQFFKSGIVIYNNFVGSQEDVIGIEKEFANYPIGVSKNNRNILSQNRDRGRLLYQLASLIYPVVWNLIGGTEKETEKKLWSKLRKNLFRPMC